MRSRSLPAPICLGPGSVAQRWQAGVNMSRAHPELRPDHPSTSVAQNAPSAQDVSFPFFSQPFLGRLREIMKELKISLHQRFLLRPGPALYFPLHLECLFITWKDLRPDTFHRSSALRVRTPNAFSMFGQATVEIVRFPRIVRAVGTFKYVDAARQETYPLAISSSFDHSGVPRVEP